MISLTIGKYSVGNILQQKQDNSGVVSFFIGPDNSKYIITFVQIIISVSLLPINYKCKIHYQK